MVLQESAGGSIISLWYREKEGNQNIHVVACVNAALGHRGVHRAHIKHIFPCWVIEAGGERGVSKTCASLGSASALPFWVRSSCDLLGLCLSVCSRSRLRVGLQSDDLQVAFPAHPV